MGKKVIFFQTYHDPKVSIQGEVKNVEEFKDRMQKQCACYEYSSKGDFENILTSTLKELM